jgi:hypothetical protein
MTASGAVATSAQLSCSIAKPPLAADLMSDGSRTNDRSFNKTIMSIRFLQKLRKWKPNAVYAYCAQMLAVRCRRY